MRARRGFTLVEAMLATGVFLLVAGGAAGLFLGVQRMTRTALAETELATGMRLLREKLLFRLERPADGTLPDGLLSGEELRSSACESSDWLNRGVTVDWRSAELVDDSRLDDDGILYLNLEMSTGGLTRGERVAVPVFGTLQKTLVGKVFP